MDDSVQVCCTRCKNVFRDRARRVQSGYSRQCPCCEVVLFFEETSPDKNIKRALNSARSVRKVLRDLEAAGPRKPPAAPRARRSY
jgi:NAD-dependent SIR2 family protein deacetylase